MNILSKIKTFFIKKEEKSSISSLKDNDGKDVYGNDIEIINRTDGTIIRTTKTNKQTEFIFLDDVYSIEQLRASVTIKVYWDRNHSYRTLVKDTYGRLFHYRWDEETYFDGDDRLDILWILVADEQDSDLLSKNESDLDLLRTPYIATCETNWVAAHEEITQLK
jgi:hypothetical protein